MNWGSCGHDKLWSCLSSWGVSSSNKEASFSHGVPCVVRGWGAAVCSLFSVFNSSQCEQRTPRRTVWLDSKCLAGASGYPSARVTDGGNVSALKVPTCDKVTGEPSELYLWLIILEFIATKCLGLFYQIQHQGGMLRPAQENHAGPCSQPRPSGCLWCASLCASLLILHHSYWKPLICQKALQSSQPR